MNIAIIGSGVIGLSIAAELSKLSDKINLTIFSDSNCNRSASKASGAMINIASEVDYINRYHPLTLLKLDRYRENISLWNDLSRYLFNDLTSLMKGEGTEVKCRRDSLNKLELLSFDSILSATKDYKIKCQFSTDAEFNSLLLPDEKSVDSNLLLDSLLFSLNSNVNISFEYTLVSSIINDTEGWKVLLANNKLYRFDYVVLCAGSFSEKILNKSIGIDNPKIKSFYGIGSALNFYSELPYVNLPKIGRIIRTPNRGGTCGIHVVERKSSIYIGASSFINPYPISGARSSSIINLFNGVNDFLNIETDKLSCDIVTGFRPVTSDACPIIGEIQKNFYCIYGTKRDGLTWAPYYSYNIAREILNMKTLSSWLQLKTYCYPYRDYNSAGTVEHCTESFILSKKNEALQHNKILDDDDVDELINIARIVHDKYNLGKGIYPELINMYYFGHINSG